MSDPDTERKHSIPDSVRDHLTAAHKHAETDQALYHIRAALQISESEVEATDDAADPLAK
ncbi:hypothetical protein GOC83_19045 [Haloarcula rubripromontorii]|uniref:Uncharacterized protein n=1 Tax=Haloarcula rubripromontorii TaxID=1705562 RepID=A0A847U9R5_9EURY|nr:hypothetical protein [Haloarcula rubripromontorii]NLV08220.1 hypothetical protein [Haloarcula rubripromontorii]